MKNVKTFESFASEQELLETANLAVIPIGVKGEAFMVKVNGNQYGYAPTDKEMSVKEIADKFAKIMKFSAGRALAWLKKNSKLVSGSAKNENEDIMKHVQDFSIFLSEAKETKEEEKQEEVAPKKKAPKVEEPIEEPSDDNDEEVPEFTPTSARDYVKAYAKAHKDKLSEKQKEEFKKLEELMKVFIKERKDAGRHYE
jgi:succinate dehydrogenase flavin-adding protein (antitoxin of CptAB toxin-antitoxin module)